MKLTATQENWNQCKATVYRDDEDQPWIAYTHEIIEQGRRGCFCRLQPNNLDQWSVVFGEKEDRTWAVPFGDPEVEIEQGEIPRVDCEDWIELHSIGDIRESQQTTATETT